MAATEPHLDVRYDFRASLHAPPELQIPPMIVFTVSGQKRYCSYVVEADGSTCYVDGVTTRVMEPKRFNVPFSLLHLPVLLARRISFMLASSDDVHLRVGTTAHHDLLRRLCQLVPDEAAEASSRGYCRLHVAVDVQMLIPHVVRYIVPPPPPPPQVVVPAEMKLKELGEIDEGESCAICFEGFKESKKKVQTVTETPCSHLFHSDCLRPWLMKATTCPLCRSALY